MNYKMSLFQGSVLKKYLKQVDTEKVSKLYKKYTKYFHNTEIQNNIKESKEEQYQAKFLDELFVKIFGYTLNPLPKFNLTTEFKNLKGAKKADGAILVDGKAVTVIELKGTKTKDLESIRQQAFDYKSHHPTCDYVITSNFEKLRFYINNSNEFEEFNLFTLKEEEFILMYLCLHQDNLLSNVPLKIKKDSVVQEEKITKEFYNAYSTFKRELFRDLVKQNMKNEVFRSELVKEDAEQANKNIKLSLFKKSQKLIDRFLFVFFAEDRGLLPPNSTRKILEQWDKLKDLDAYVPLYDRFKLYFGYLDTGRKKDDKSAEIFAYNGGLFKPDGILDSLLINDELLYKHTMKLSDYDFDSQVDVNILGHIFENSLNEIESVNAEIEGVEFDKQKTKRKKDGVFYTPKYITKYIVDNTVGKLCEEKKNELGVLEEEYLKSRKGRSKAKLKELLENLESYREWLLQITILDPACGSGAFLNQALDFLITEHRYIDELQANLLGGSIVFQDIENKVLENNIFGVDLNEESVEIAKLSLWLRTAAPRRKLNSLNNNIKCGNSLIESKSVAGNKSFDWGNEFSEIFKKGGFDVVIGNPPYVNMNEFPKPIHEYFESEYKSIHTGYNDLMYYFLFKGINLLKEGGEFGVITSNYFIGNDYAKGLRNFLSKHLKLLVNFEKYHVFNDANVHTAILLAEKNPKTDSVIFESYKSSNPITEISNNSVGFRLAKIDRNKLKDNWIIADESKLKLISKLSSINDLLGDISEIAKGSESGKNEVFTVDEEVIKQYNLERSVLRKCVKNSDIKAFSISLTEQYLIYSDNNFSKEHYPNTYKYLEDNKDLLLDRRGPRTGEYEWWRLHRPSIKELFEADEKILVPYRAEKNRFGYDNQQLFNNGGDIRAIKITNKEYDTKFITAVLNSALINWYYGFIGKPKGNSREYFNKPLSQIPIAKADRDTQNKLSSKTDDITEVKSQTENIISLFCKYLQTQFSIQKLSKKLLSWFSLDFSGFVKELNKAIKKAGGEKLSKMDEMDWMEVFETKKSEVQNLKSQINQIDNEINQLVYELYGLTEEEIKIVEEVNN